MRTPVILSAVALFLMDPALSPAGSGARATREYRFEGATRVNATTFSGSITVESWDEKSIAVHAIEKAGDDHQLQGIRIRAEKRGGTAVIEVDFDDAFARNLGDAYFCDAAADLRISVPPDVELTLEASEGDRVEVRGVTGPVHVRATEGDIDIANSHGSIIAYSEEGDIRVRDHDGAVTATTQEGDVSLEGRLSRILVSTIEGSITVSSSALETLTLEADGEFITEDPRAAGATLLPSGDRPRWSIRGGDVFAARSTGAMLTVRSVPHR